MKLYLKYAEELWKPKNNSVRFKCSCTKLIKKLFAIYDDRCVLKIRRRNFITIFNKVFGANLYMQTLTNINNNSCGKAHSIPWDSFKRSKFFTKPYINVHPLCLSQSHHPKKQNMNSNENGYCDVHYFCTTFTYIETNIRIEHLYDKSFILKASWILLPTNKR